MGWLVIEDGQSTLEKIAECMKRKFIMQQKPVLWLSHPVNGTHSVIMWRIMFMNIQISSQACFDDASKSCTKMENWGHFYQFSNIYIDFP